MTKQIAIDWDDNELRLVVGQSSLNQTSITDAAIIPMLESGIFDTLRQAIKERGLEKTETLVAIGRGKAELRELALPPVPDEELPDIVRFQAVRNFASAGESATIDYLVTKRTESNVHAIAAAVTPANLKEVREIITDAGLNLKRVTLRPLSAAVLYLASEKTRSLTGDIVLVDLLADDAEIIVARDGAVVFVRTVRMPSADAARPKALVNEMKRSLLACGCTEPEKIVIWGRAENHAATFELLNDAMNGPVEFANPFDFVTVDSKIQSKLPDHVGRLAPLIGLVACEDRYADRLIDFLAPRERPEEKKDYRRTALLVGLPIAAVLLVSFAVYRQLAALDNQVAVLNTMNTKLKKDVVDADKSVASIEKLDQFLDADAIWINELRLLAEKLPPSQEVILKAITATSDVRTGESTLMLSGSAVSPSVIEKLETSIRDEHHSVASEGASEQDAKDAYKWAFSEKITIPAYYARNLRYEGIQKATAKPEVALEVAPEAKSE